MYKKFYQKGFTLIELLVVIAIIGILSSVVLGNIRSAHTKARDTRRRSDLNQIKNALELYINDKGNYPGVVGGYYNISDNNYPGATPCPGSTGGLQGYLSGSDVCQFKDPSSFPYVYEIDSNGKYNIGSEFELSQNQTVPFTYNNGANTLTGYYSPNN